MVGEGEEVNATEAALRKISKPHGPYWSPDGKRLLGVTTILNQVIAKPALYKWNNQMGLKGIDTETYVDELAGVGTLAHRMILGHLRGNGTDNAEFSRLQIDLAENCFIKYLEWERQHAVEPLVVETPMVSGELGFGGTLDFYGHIDGQPCLLDFKTGKGIYDDHWYQLGGYSLLLAERPSCYRILNIGRDESERFVEEQRESIDAEREIFLHALAIYRLKQKKGKH